MSYSAEMIPMILKSYGLSIEYAETQINDFMEIDIYKIINPRAMTRTLLREMSDALAENAIATFRDCIFKSDIPVKGNASGILRRIDEWL